jgi:hypothetical protein
MKHTHTAACHVQPSVVNTKRNSLPLYRCASALLALALVAGSAASAPGETCITQSALTPANRTALTDTVRNLATLVQSNNAAALRAVADPALTRDFASFQNLLGDTAPRLATAAFAIDQLYVLDATSLKPNADGTPSDAQFICSLNHSTVEARFSISALPPGTYAFATATSSAPSGAATLSPWRLSFLMHQDGTANHWLLAGFYPKPTTAAGHDGLWYWSQARQFVIAKQPWNAWLYYQAAAHLLQPAPFVTSTHFDKLRTEAANAAPAALSEGVSVDAPLVLKASDGTEYHFTALDVDDSFAQSSLDIAAHLRVDSVADPVAAHKRNNDAAAALLAPHPELRKPFHGVWIYAEVPGQNPFATEQPMSEINSSIDQAHPAAKNESTH